MEADMGQDYRLRKATMADRAALRALIERSSRGLGRDDYTAEQIEGALASAFGVDTSLIQDGTYYVVETPSGEIVGCGGWGRRRTLFGNDDRGERDDSWLDPRHEAAKIRAFFIDPAHARRGLGRRLLDESEREARAAGFTSFELMATLPGQRLYEQCGYVAGTPVEHPLEDGQQITFIPMTKRAPI